MQHVMVAKFFDSFKQHDVSKDASPCWNTRATDFDPHLSHKTVARLEYT